jgi:hypothetical protein
LVERRPFPRWAYAAAIEDVGKAPTLEALDQVVAHCRNLAQDQGRVELEAAIRTRRVELALAAGEAVSRKDHLRALERARAEELARVLEELRAMAAGLEGEGRLARGRGRQLEAAGKDEHARLIRRAARRVAGGR